jgi:hypothetical protein
VLHASAVAVAGQGAVLFAGGKGSGKTTLAAGLLREGHELLGDDVVSLEEAAGGVLARPSYPRLRLWPDQVRALTAMPVEGLRRVHPEVDKRWVPVGEGGWGRFRAEPERVRCLYLVEGREGGAPSFAAVAPAEALVALSAAAFLPRMVHALGWQRRRLGLLGHLVEAVPVRRLRYPLGFDRLAGVSGAVAADLARLPAAP